MPVPTPDHQSETWRRQEVENLLNMFENKCEKVESALESMDDDKQRNEYIKSLLRKEYTQTLSMMCFTEAETMRLLRSASMETLLKAKSEATKIKKKLKELKDKPECREVEGALLVSLENILEDVEYLRRNSELHICFDQKRFQHFFKQSCYFKTLDWDHTNFKLDYESVFRSKVWIITENPNSFKNEFLLNCIEVIWTSLSIEEEASNRVEYGTIILKDTLRGILKKNYAKMIDKHCVELNFPPNPSKCLQLQVMFLGMTIDQGIFRMKTEGGKMLETSRFLDQKSFYAEDDRSMKTNNGTSICEEPRSIMKGNGRSMLDLDQSDIVSLDMTKRKEVTPSIHPKEDKIRNQSKAPQPLGTGTIQLSTVQEVSDDPLNVSTPFSIVSEAQYSTMRETSAAKLAEMLASASATVSLVESDSDVKLKEDEFLAPMSESGRKSVEEMQKSLSTENSPSNTQEIVDITDVNGCPPAERSILFAPKTTIYQELATPQVKQDNKRYKIKEGKTKALGVKKTTNFKKISKKAEKKAEKDGVAGIAAMQRSKQASERKDKTDHRDVQETIQYHANGNIDQERRGRNDGKTCEITNGDVDKSSKYSSADNEAVESQNKFIDKEKEKEILDRRSKAQDRNGNFIPEAEIKEEPGEETRDKTVLEESIFEDHDLVVEEEAESHPLQDSRWEETMNADPVQEPEPLDGTIWAEIETKTPDFCFTSGKIKVTEVFSSREDCLQMPTFMTHLKKHKTIAIVETTKQRIGVYDDESLELKGWFPCWRNDIVFPLHILDLSSGKVALIESLNGIGIYEFAGEKYTRRSLLKGEYKGLAETNKGELLSIEVHNKKVFLRIFSKTNEQPFVHKDSIEIKIAHNELSAMKGSPRYLAYFEDKVYVSDMGVGRIYIIDLNTREQTNIGSYGEGPCQFMSPLPLLIDDVGNILVADNKLGKLHLFSATGQHINRISLKTKLSKKPYGILRVNNMMYLSMCDHDQKYNGIVRLELVSSNGNKDRKGKSPLDILI